MIHTKMQPIRDVIGHGVGKDGRSVDFLACMHVVPRSRNRAPRRRCPDCDPVMNSADRKVINQRQRESDARKRQESKP